MSVTLATREFVGLLADTRHTAADDPELPNLRTVLLHSTRGDFTPDTSDDDDTEAFIGAVPSDLLVATSTDRYAASQAHTATIGRLPRPVMVPLPDVKAIIDVFQPLIRSLGRDQTHNTTLDLTGEVLTVAEDRTQVPDGRSVSMTVSDPDGAYPTGLARALDPDPSDLPRDDNGAFTVAARGGGLGARFVAIAARVGKRRGMPVMVYRHHQDRPVVVEVGNSYRAVMRPSPVDPEILDEPQVPVFEPFPDEYSGGDGQVSVDDELERVAR